MMTDDRRRHYKVDQLPPDIKSQVDDMLAANFKYADIVEYIQSEAHMSISPMAISRYARNMQKTIQTLHMAQENFRVIMDEINKYPSLDISEAILRLLSHVVVDNIQNTPEDQWKSIKPEDLIKQSTSLVKAAAYKKNMDLKNEDIMNAGFEQVKTMLFELLARERPEQYKELAEFLESKRGELS